MAALFWLSAATMLTACSRRAAACMETTLHIGSAARANGIPWVWDFHLRFSSCTVCLAYITTVSVLLYLLWVRALSSELLEAAMAKKAASRPLRAQVYARSH